MDLSPIIAELATKHNLSKRVVESITNSQWSFIKSKILEGTHESILINKLGKFAVKPNRLKYLYERFPHLDPKNKEHNGGLEKHSIPKYSRGSFSEDETIDMPPMQ